MRSEAEIRKEIEEIEDRYDPEDEYTSHDEGEQATLMALYWVLGESQYVD